MTECTTPMLFSFLEKKPVVADFDGGEISSHGGALLLGDVDRELGLTAQLAACIEDERDPNRVTHTLADLVAQRVYQIALGHPEANASDDLRLDPMVKVAAGRAPETGKPLASQPTISRLENQVGERELFRMSAVILQQFLAKYAGEAVSEIELDIDSSEDPAHGQQQLVLFNGFYDSYCYLPVFVHASVNGGEQQEPIAAVLRPSNDNHKGVLSIVRAVVRRLREAFPKAKIRLRADGGFGSPQLYTLLEAEGVGYHLGLAKNQKLVRLIEPLMAQVRYLYQWRRTKVCAYGEIRYQAKSWEKERRVVVKAEILEDGKENPRFVLVHDCEAEPVEEYGRYCARGDDENRLKELKLDLRSDLTSCHRFLANQFRLLLTVAAYLLLRAVRDRLQGTELARAQVGTLQRVLLWVGARVKESVRRVRIYLPTSYRYRRLFRRAAGQAIAAA